MSPFNSNLPLSPFHNQTVIRDWGNGQGFTIGDAVKGVLGVSQTGGGKTSGILMHLAFGYLAGGFGGLILCTKGDEGPMWKKWIAACGRTDDLIVVDASGKHRFNFLEWEASNPNVGAGLTLNIVAILDEIAEVVAKSAGMAAGGGGDDKFWRDGLHHLLLNLVDLCLLAGTVVSLALLRSILNSAPRTILQVLDQNWIETSICARILAEADKATANASPDVRADFEEVRDYFLLEFPALSEKTRTIFTLMFSMLVRPILTRPLRNIFCSDTTVKPEDAFDGKIILVDLPVQDYRVAGRIAGLAFKFCMQVALMRRRQPDQPNAFLRPVFIAADEFQNFITPFDSQFQAVARSAGGCSLYLTQNRESLRRALGDNDAVDSLLANLVTKFFLSNTGETTEWAAKLIGERWLRVTSTNVGRSGVQTPHETSGVTRSEQRRYYVEPSRFTTLRSGGPANNYLIDAIVYKGGHLFPDPSGNEPFLPYKFLTLTQNT